MKTTGLQFELAEVKMKKMNCVCKFLANSNWNLIKNAYEFAALKRTMFGSYYAAAPSHHLSVMWHQSTPHFCLSNFRGSMNTRSCFKRSVNQCITVSLSTSTTMILATCFLQRNLIGSLLMIQGSAAPEAVA